MSGKGHKGKTIGKGFKTANRPGIKGRSAGKAGSTVTGPVPRMLGLCRRAGKVLSGDTAVEKSVLRNEVKALVMARDAAPRSKEKYIRLAEEKSIPVFFYASRDELGKLLGKPPRAVVAITDEQLARGVAGAMERGDAGL